MNLKIATLLDHIEKSIHSANDADDDFNDNLNNMREAADELRSITNSTVRTCELEGHSFYFEPEEILGEMMSASDDFNYNINEAVNAIKQLQKLEPKWRKMIDIHDCYAWKTALSIVKEPENKKKKKSKKA